MKKNFLTKLAAVALVMGTVVTALPASATVYCSDTLTGKSTNTSREVIEGTDMYLSATARVSSGTAFGRQVVSSGSDKRVAAVSVANDGSDPITDRSAFFDADGSSYYIHWSGSTNGSKANVRFVG